MRGCTSCSTKIDVVILRSSGSNGYNDYIYAMNGVDSVETLVITTAKDSNTAAVETTVKNAEVVFFAGGDQCDYVEVLQGDQGGDGRPSRSTPGAAASAAPAPGSPSRGTSATTAAPAAPLSSDALANPYHRTITFTYDFFHWANLQGTITDSHFVTRDRMGRTLAFLARQIKDGKAASALGVAVNEATSVEVDKNGLAHGGRRRPGLLHPRRPRPETCRPACR